jgi:hypothetical protein
VVVVGHGLWVAIAWLLRGGRPRGDRASYEPTLGDDRAAMARYLEHLRSHGLIDPDLHTQMMRLIVEDVHPVRAYLDKKHGLAEAAKPEMGVVETGGRRPMPEVQKPKPAPASRCSVRRGS